jgi:hypothetical protein
MPNAMTGDVEQKGCHTNRETAIVEVVVAAAC